MAAVTPSSPNVDWTWSQRAPILADSRGTSPPLELQLLPPTSFTAAESPWGLDPSRLQQLMMGSAPGYSPANAPYACSSVRDLGALFDDNGANQPLPSGWERCLDLQSGEVFLKKTDAAVKVLQTPCSSHGELYGKGGKQNHTENGGWSEAYKPADESRQDWSSRWKGELELTFGSTQHEGMMMVKASEVSKRASLGRDTDTRTFPDREPLCLDLDLRLTNQKICKAGTDGRDASAGNPICRQESIQPWKWEQCGNGGEKPASIQDMARESTMVTAVCSKCLMYVLLRKSCPVCPRCSVPIVLDGGSASSLSRKRPRFELSRDALSLSKTDPSR